MLWSIAPHVKNETKTGVGGDQRDSQHLGAGEQPVRLPIPRLHGGRRGAELAAGGRPLLRQALDVPRARASNPGLHTGVCRRFCVVVFWLWLWFLAFVCFVGFCLAVKVSHPTGS